MSKQLTIKDVTASNLSLINEEQFNFLFKATPKTQQYKRPAKGGGTWTYVTGSYVKKVLNFITGFNWDFEVIEKDLFLDAGQVVILGKLTVRLDGHEVVKMQYGRSDIKFRRQTDQQKQTGAARIPLDIGNDFKAATTDALKKCASELGVAQDIYGMADFKEVQVVNSTIDVKNDELIEMMEGCESLEQLAKFYEVNKTTITRDINLVSAFGNAKKLLENAG